MRYYWKYIIVFMLLFQQSPSQDEQDIAILTYQNSILESEIADMVINHKYLIILKRLYYATYR